jgi:DUF1009 family protein
VTREGPRAVGLIAGSGRFPFYFARGARRAGLRVVACAHEGETDPSLAHDVDSLTWVKVGQISRILDAFHREGVREAAMAGAIGKLRALRQARPDLKFLKALSSLRHLNDDGLLRALARAFEEDGIQIIHSTAYMKEVLAAKGPLSSRVPTAEELKDVALGWEVAHALGRADVGQTVVVRRGVVIAVEAAEGTDACICRAGELAGEGIVVVKRCKPLQDSRFDLPAVGPTTIETLAAAKGAVLAVEAEKTVVLDAVELVERADRHGIAVIAT